MLFARCCVPPYTPTEAFLMTWFGNINMFSPTPTLEYAVHFHYIPFLEVGGVNTHGFLTPLPACVHFPASEHLQQRKQETVR
jgi:hypothetical protein